MTYMSSWYFGQWTVILKSNWHLCISSLNVQRSTPFFLYLEPWCSFIYWLQRCHRFLFCFVSIAMVLAHMLVAAVWPLLDWIFFRQACLNLRCLTQVATEWELASLLDRISMGNFEEWDPWESVLVPLPLVLESWSSMPYWRHLLHAFELDGISQEKPDSHV